MKKDQRVCRNEEFSEIIQRRRYAKSPALTMHFAKRKQDHARIGISVGKKIGNAVVRTKTKRQLRALIDEVFDFAEPFDVIMIVRPPFLELDYFERKEMLEKLRKQALASFHSRISRTKNISAKNSADQDADISGPSKESIKYYKEIKRKS